MRDTVACCFLSLHCKFFLLAGCNIARNPIRTWMQKRTSFEFSAKRLYLPHKTPSDSQIPAICIISVPLLLIIHERTQFFCATSKAQACMESYFQSKVLLRITQKHFNLWTQTVVWCLESQLDRLMTSHNQINSATTSHGPPRRQPELRLEFS